MKKLLGVILFGVLVASGFAFADRGDKPEECVVAMECDDKQACTPKPCCESECK